MTAPGTSALPVGVAVANGLRTVNFFNGRLLTAGDLRREQDTAEALRKRLGLAVGDGVVRGLRVGRPGGPDPRHPVVDVTAGVAVAPSGAALELADDVRVTLAGAAVAPPTGASPSFAACSGLPDGSSLTVAGVYLLTVAPAGSPVGRAPTSGLGPGAGGCDADACAEGVAFRVVHLGLDAALLADRAHLRSRLAQLLLGTDDPRRTRLQRAPFTTPATGYGLLDDLRERALDDDEVPLAVALWTPGVGVEFVDEWCVRRGVAATGADPDLLPEVTSDRRRVTAQARLLQFQAELADLASRPGALALRASAAFSHLPAAGLIPQAGGQPGQGFDFRTFFADLAPRGPFVLEGTDVVGCLGESLDHEPIDLASGHLVWLYTIRQNPDGSGGPRPPGGFVLFAAGALRYRGDARFNLGHYNAANFAGMS